MKTWIRGEDFSITREIVAKALDVPIVQQPTYPYTEIPPIDDIMSLLCGETVSWGTDPRITTHELTELNYLFFRIACHNIYPISHVDTTPIDRCVFWYALIADAFICFPTLFILSLVEVFRSNSRTHGLFFLVFLHRVLLHLELEHFPPLVLVHIIAPIGATFLRQRAAQKKLGVKRPRVESSIGSPIRGQSTVGDLAMDEAFVDPIAAMDSSASTSYSPIIRIMLETCLTTQAAHG